MKERTKKLIPWVGGKAQLMWAIQMLLPAVKPWMDLARVALLYGTGMAVVLLPVNTAARMERFRPKWWQAAALAVLTAWSVLSFTGITTFIYSNF